MHVSEFRSSQPTLSPAGAMQPGHQSRRMLCGSVPFRVIRTTRRLVAGPCRFAVGLSRFADLCHFGRFWRYRSAIRHRARDTTIRRSGNRCRNRLLPLEDASEQAQSPRLVKRVHDGSALTVCSPTWQVRPALIVEALGRQRHQHARPDLTIYPCGAFETPHHSPRCATQRAAPKAAKHTKDIPSKPSSMSRAMTTMSWPSKGL